MDFLSDEWFTALDAAARARRSADDDALASVAVSVEQVVTGGPTWRLVIDHGTLRIERGVRPEPADVRLTSDVRTAADIAAGRRAALDAFMHGDLVIGGDVSALLEHAAAMATVGDLFAEVRDRTRFPDGA